MDTEFMLDVYDGAYGLTFRIDVQEYESLKLLASLFLKLSSEKTISIDLLPYSTWESRHDKMFRVMLINSNSRQRLSIKKGSDGSVLEIEWSNSRIGWLDNAHFVNGLIQGSGNGHQYFWDDNDDAKLVELYFQE